MAYKPHRNMKKSFSSPATFQTAQRKWIQANRTKIRKLRVSGEVAWLMEQGLSKSEATTHIQKNSRNRDLMARLG